MEEEINKNHLWKVWNTFHRDNRVTDKETLINNCMSEMKTETQIKV